MYSLSFAVTAARHIIELIESVNAEIACVVSIIELWNVLAVPNQIVTTKKIKINIRRRTILFR